MIVATTRFYATKADLEPGIREAEAQRRLKYVRCRPGGYASGPVPEIFSTFLDLPDLPLRSEGRHSLLDRIAARVLGRRLLGGPQRNESSQPIYFVIDADTDVFVREHIFGSATPRPRLEYRVETEQAKPVLGFAPGGLSEDQGLQPGSVWMSDLADVGGLSLYRFLARTLTGGFEQIGGYLFGPEAVHLIEAGRPFLEEGSLQPSHRDTLKVMKQSDATQRSLTGPRLSWEETAAFMGWDGRPVAEEEGEDAAEQIDDAGEGEEFHEYVSQSLDYFRSGEDRKRFDHLNLRRSYLAKSYFELTSFRDTDLSGSRIVCDDWLDCDFSDADLTGAFVAALFVGCNFTGAVLERADLRQSDFIDCQFGGAKLAGAKLLHEHRDKLPLTGDQVADIDWHADPGPEPYEA